jgi:putative transposase
MLDAAALKELLAKNGRARRVSGGLRSSPSGLRHKRAAGLPGHRGGSSECAIPRAPAALRERLRQLAHERRRFGYRRLHVLLRREGHVVNRKRLYRLYRAERPMVRRGGGRKRALGMRAPIALPAAANERWSLDFVHDQMVDGRRFRILAVDDCTRECLALVADTSIPGLRVARELDRIVEGDRAAIEISVTRQPSTGPNRSQSVLHSVGIGEPLHLRASRCSQNNFR